MCVWKVAFNFPKQFLFLGDGNYMSVRSVGWFICVILHESRAGKCLQNACSPLEICFHSHRYRKYHVVGKSVRESERTKGTVGVEIQYKVWGELLRAFILRDRLVHSRR